MSDTQIIHTRTLTSGKTVEISLERETQRDGTQSIRLIALHDGKPTKHPSGNLSEINDWERQQHNIPAELTHRINNIGIPAETAAIIAAAELEVGLFNTAHRAEVERLTTNKEIRVIQKENGETIYTLDFDGNDGYGRHLEPQAVLEVLGALEDRPHTLKGWWNNYPISLEEYLEIIAWQPAVCLVAIPSEITLSAPREPTPLSPYLQALVKRYGSSERAWELEDESAWNALRQAGF